LLKAVCLFGQRPERVTEAWKRVKLVYICFNKVSTSRVSATTSLYVFTPSLGLCNKPCDNRREKR
jgi:hypothetical protein